MTLIEPENTKWAKRSQSWTHQVPKKFKSEEIQEQMGSKVYDIYEPWEG